MTTNTNYTKVQETTLTNDYNAKEVSNKDFVAAIADTMGKSVKSVTAKLVSLGVYKTEAKLTKTGVPVISKKELVAQIEAHYGFEVPSLVKATKVDLQNLVDNLG
jgi:hypothetical protein